MSESNELLTNTDLQTTLISHNLEVDKFFHYNLPNNLTLRIPIMGDKQDLYKLWEELGAYLKDQPGACVFGQHLIGMVKE